MKNRIYTLLLALSALWGVCACSSLDLEPESSIADNGYWKTADQFNAFFTGLNTHFRGQCWNCYAFGELRAGFYGDVPFGGEATQGMEDFHQNNLSVDRPGISNYGGFYNPINQINLMVEKTKESTTVPEEDKAYYLGACYGMRAYLYFHLLRSYGDVIIYTDYTSGSTLDLANLNRAQDPKAKVLEHIKQDIAESEASFNGNYAFTKGKNYWSLGATQMLKADVYLWSGKQEGGGAADYAVARKALQAVENCEGLELLPLYADVFSFDNKKNAEIIYSIAFAEKEYDFLGGSWRGNYIPQQNYMGNFYVEDGEGGIVSTSETKDKELNGLVRVPLLRGIYDKLYLDNDSRKRTNLRAVYTKDAETGDYAYMASFPYKYQGTMLAGGAAREFLDDFPVYRYADAILMMAEVKVLLGEDPSAEINRIRRRAYGDSYSDAEAYPNDGGAFYDGNEFVGGDDDPTEAVLKERLREMIFEGRRWYDLRLFNMTDAYSNAQANRLLWPIDQNTLTNNNLLKQTPGYER